MGINLTWCEIEQIWEWAPVGQSGILISQFIKVGISQRVKRQRSGSWVEYQESCHEINCFLWCPGSENSVPRERLDLRESVLFVFWVHSKNLVSLRSSEDLDNLDELVNSTFSWEYRLSKHEFSDDTSDSPDVDLCCILRVAEDQFRRSIIS